MENVSVKCLVIAWVLGMLVSRIPHFFNESDFNATHSRISGE